MSDTIALQSPSRPRNYVGWALQVLLGVAFLAAGAAKLSGAEMMVQIFDQIGFGQGFRIFTGLIEVAGAVALLIPGFAGPAALWLGFTMLCAVITHLAILHTNPAPAAVLMVLNGVVAWLRRDQITALLGRFR